MLDECLAALSDTFDQSKSDLARNSLKIHFHLRPVFEQLVANHLWKLTRRVEKAQPEPVARYNAKTPSAVPESPARQLYTRAFVKSTRDLKVWMPSKLQAAIVLLAEQCGQSDSEYMRRALTAYYMGRGVIDPVR